MDKGRIKGRASQARGAGEQAVLERASDSNPWDMTQFQARPNRRASAGVEAIPTAAVLLLAVAAAQAAPSMAGVPRFAGDDGETGGGAAGGVVVVAIVVSLLVAVAAFPSLSL